MNTKRVTIYDVAKEAGVSVATVSRVLSKKNIYIKETTRNKVLQVVKNLNYVMNPFAANLSRKRSNLIALIYEGSDALFSSFYHVQLAQAIYNFLEPTDFNVILYAPKKEELENMGLALRAQGVEGAILEAGQLDEQFILNIDTANYPYVLTGQKSKNSNINNVYVDNYNGLKLAFDYLFSLGHRKIGYVHSNLGFTANKERYQGYRDSFSAHKLKYRTTYEVVSQPGVFGGVESLEKIMAMKNRPTAFICENDEKAIGILKAALQKKVPIPETFSIIGFDDIALGQYVEPELTTIKIPMKEIAEVGVSYLISLIQNKKWKKFRKKIMPQLVIRNSCKPV